MNVRWSLPGKQGSKVLVAVHSSVHGWLTSENASLCATGFRPAIFSACRVHVDFLGTTSRSTLYLTSTAMFKLLFALALTHLCLVAAKTTHETFIELADATPDGVIRLNEETFELLTSSKRNYSALVQFTAMGKNMKCTPCK